MVRAIPPDESDWSIEARPTATGVDLEVGFTLGGERTKLRLAVGRADAREFARTTLAAAGDATERTFPRPILPGGADG